MTVTALYPAPLAYSLRNSLSPRSFYGIRGHLYVIILLRLLLTLFVREGRAPVRIALYSATQTYTFILLPVIFVPKQIGKLGNNDRRTRSHEGISLKQKATKRKYDERNRNYEMRETVKRMNRI